MLVSEALNNYLGDIKHLRPRTQQGYEQRLLLFSAWCTSNNLHLEQIKNAQVYLFLEYIQAHQKPHALARETLTSSTLHGYVSVIKGFLRWCINDEEYGEFVKLAVLNRIKMPKLEETIIETFTVEQIDALFLACQKEESADAIARARAMLALLIDTGIRAGELVNLKIGHVNLKSGDAHIRVLGKGQKWREIPLGTKSRRFLARYVTLCRPDAPKAATVFLGRYHNPFTTGGLQQVLNRLKEYAGLTCRCNPHKFRHTFARMFWLQCNDILMVSKFLGHAEISTTMEYLKSLTATDVRLSFQ